jgi:aspartate carbamoyltransferase catalytic subunit
VLTRLPPGAIVLSPLPVIDEINQSARRDARLRMFWQSDQAVFVRMALLERFAASP